ncbi:hypothetical protein [Streptomyces lunaelactis]|nr:hypothetical protein [Streptomyces lunaelactis]
MSVLALILSIAALAMAIGSIYYALKAAKYRRETEAIYRNLPRR